MDHAWDSFVTLDTVQSFDTEDGTKYRGYFQSCAPDKERAATSSFLQWLVMLNALDVQHPWS